MVDLKNINAVKEKMSEIQGHFKSGLTGEDKVFLDRVYFLLLGKNVSNKGCGSCYHDAFVICSLKLRELETMPKFEYSLKAGAVLVEPMTGKSYVGGIPADVAEKFLKINKAKWLPLFAEVPTDLDARLAGNSSKVDGASKEETKNEETESDIAEVEPANKRKVGRPKKF